MNPMMVAQNRTARLVREASTPVYTTVTRPQVREHLEAVEVEDEMGRFWSTVPASQVKAHCDKAEEMGYWISDIDHSAKCWCQK